MSWLVAGSGSTASFYFEAPASEFLPKHPQRIGIRRNAKLHAVAARGQRSKAGQRAAALQPACAAPHNAKIPFSFPRARFRSFPNDML